MKHVILLLGVLCYNILSAQTPYTTFQNPSFEGDTIISGNVPFGWENAFSPTSPDTQPCGSNIVPFDGSTCLGLIGNGAFVESVKQQLNKTLIINNNYYFDIYLRGWVLWQGMDTNIQFWLGDSTDNERQLIGEKLVLDGIWEKHTFLFNASNAFDYFTIKCTSQYVLADLISPIYEGYPTVINTPSMASLEIAIYPNPTTNQLQINGEYTTATLYNLTGQLLLNTTSKQINLANFPQGMYILLCYDAEGRVIHREKVVKQ